MREVTPDKEKARSLLKMAKRTKERIKSTEIERFPSQVLMDYYDTLHYLMEGISSADGCKSEGKGAHKKLIQWTASEYDLRESEKHFLDQVRRQRNKISYEGFTVESEYIKRNLEKFEGIIEKLKEVLESKVN